MVRTGLPEEISELGFEGWVGIWHPWKSKVILGRESSVYKSKGIWLLVGIVRGGAEDQERKRDTFQKSQNRQQKQHNHGGPWGPREGSREENNIPYSIGCIPSAPTWCLKYSKSSMLFVKVYNCINSALFIKCQWMPTTHVKEWGDAWWALINHSTSGLSSAWHREDPPCVCFTFNVRNHVCASCSCLL